MVITPSLKVYNRINKISAKRAFFPSFSFPHCIKGSMAIEGSLVLPCFLFFMMTVLLSLEAVRFQSDAAEALYQTGNQITARGYQVKYEGAVPIGAEALLKEYLDGQFLPYFCVEGKEDGVVVKEASCADTGEVVIDTEYRLAPFINWLPIGEVVVKDRFLGHLWVGYSGNERQGTVKEEEIYVYITKTGTKYHLSADCSYLRLQIKALDAFQIEESRNKWGGKYYPCSRCDAGKTGTVYVTEDGNNYHSHGNCSSLKRTVYLVPLHEAEGYGACSRCGG